MKLRILAGLTACALLVQAPAILAAQPVPLTFPAVCRFFSHTLQLRATEVHQRCQIFYEGEWKNHTTYNYCVILVENSDEDLQVTFYITDDQEMNWVNEFLDSQFFTRSESENLFRLLNRRKNSQDKRVGRFRVDISHWQPRHAEIIVVSLTPLSGGPGKAHPQR